MMANSIQFFNTLSSKFLQIITNLTEGVGELEFPERLKRLYVIIIFLIMLLSYYQWQKDQTFYTMI